MSVFDQLGRQPQDIPARGDPRQEMQSLRADPGTYLKKRGFDVPEGMTDPMQITRYLIQSGQVGNNRYQAALRLLSRR